MTIPAVDSNDLRITWEHWPLLQEQAAGGRDRLRSKLTAQADIKTLLQHCAVLQGLIQLGRINPAAIDFVEAAKPIPLSEPVELKPTGVEAIDKVIREIEENEPLVEAQRQSIEKLDELRRRSVNKRPDPRV